MQKNQQSEPTLIFVHIPKTAGTTFRAILEKNYKNKLAYEVKWPNEIEDIKLFQQLPQDKRNSYDLIFGHLTIGIHEYLTRPFKYVAFFRDPVSRFISGYYYIRRQKLNRYHEIVLKMSPEEYLDFRIFKGIDNFQMRHLSNNIQAQYASDIDPMLEMSGFLSIEKEYEIALQNLELIDYALITESFDTSLFLLKNELKWRDITYRVMNESRMRPEEGLIGRMSL